MSGIDAAHRRIGKFFGRLRGRHNRVPKGYGAYRGWQTRMAICIGVPAVALVTVCVIGPADNWSRAKEDAIMRIKSSDLLSRVVVTGELGEPLGTLVTVAGDWQLTAQNGKDASLCFVVTHVKGSNGGSQSSFVGRRSRIVTSSLQRSYSSRKAITGSCEHLREVHLRAVQKMHSARLRGRKWAVHTMTWMSHIHPE